jgi:Phosphate-selective porin O and P.
MNKKSRFWAWILAIMIPVCASAQEPQKITLDSSKSTIVQQKELEKKKQAEISRIQEEERERQIKIQQEEQRTKAKEAKIAASKQAEIENIKADVNEMKAKLSKMLNISGYVNTQYTWGQDVANTFQIRRARFDIKGNLSKKAEYRVQFDFANSAKLIDAFLKYKFTNAFNVQVGQFKVPFSLENPYSPLKMESIEYSQVISKLSGFSDLSGLSGNGRDLGLAVYGGFIHNNDKNFNYFEYNVGVFNGGKINAKDIDTRKDFAGRIEVHPIKPATVGFSYYNGMYDNDLTNDTTALAERIRYGAGLKYDDGKYLLRAEYIWGTTADKESKGYYAVAGMKFAKQLGSFIKYDYFQSDITADNTASTWYVCGLEYWPFPYIRLQVNYTLKNKSVEGINEYKNMIGAMVSYKF